jgi:PST family polysaccharide transporter
MKKYLRHPVVQNALALYSVQFAEYILPMLTIPFLARILQPAGWGMVIYAQNFSGWMILVMEFGFGFSATREIARHRDNTDRHADVVGGVVGANFLLLLPAILIAIVSRFTIPAFVDHPGYLWLSLAIAVTSGFRPFWYFQGIEKMKFAAWMNVVGRLLYTGGIFAFVRSQQGGWKVLALQAISGLVVTTLIVTSMYRRVAFRWPTLARSVAALKAGWAIFLSRSAVMLYTMANTVILGLFASTAAVAYYGGAEKVVLAVLGLMTPFTQALYPRMSHLAANNKEKATDAIRIGLLFFGAVGLLTTVALIAAAPWIIRVLVGPAYTPAIAVMRVASLIVPLVAMSNILGMQWMLPFGMDRAFNRISLGAGLLNVGLAVFLAPRFGPIGTAWSVVAAQAFVTGSMCVLFFRAKRPQFAEGVPS